MFIWAIIFFIVAIVVLALAFTMGTKQRTETRQRDRYRDPETVTFSVDTGAKCQREEFHLENHYRDVGGRLVHW